MKFFKALGEAVVETCQEMKNEAKQENRKLASQENTKKTKNNGLFVEQGEVLSGIPSPVNVCHINYDCYWGDNN